MYHIKINDKNPCFVFISLTGCLEPLWELFPEEHHEIEHKMFWCWQEHMEIFKKNL